jgi:hypothetical protein
MTNRHDDNRKRCAAHSTAQPSATQPYEKSKTKCLSGQAAAAPGHFLTTCHHPTTCHHYYYVLCMHYCTTCLTRGIHADVDNNSYVLPQWQV